MSDNKIGVPMLSVNVDLTILALTKHSTASTLALHPVQLEKCDSEQRMDVLTAHEFGADQMIPCDPDRTVQKFERAILTSLTTDLS